MRIFEDLIDNVKDVSDVIDKKQLIKGRDISMAYMQEYMLIQIMRPDMTIDEINSIKENLEDVLDNEPNIEASEITVYSTNDRHCEMNREIKSSKLSNFHPSALGDVIKFEFGYDHLIKNGSQAKRFILKLLYVLKDYQNLKIYFTDMKHCLERRFIQRIEANEIRHNTLLGYSQLIRYCYHLIPISQQGLKGYYQIMAPQTKTSILDFLVNESLDVNPVYLRGNIDGINLKLSTIFKNAIQKDNVKQYFNFCTVKYNGENTYDVEMEELDVIWNFSHIYKIDGTEFDKYVIKDAYWSYGQVNDEQKIISLYIGPGTAENYNYPCDFFMTCSTQYGHNSKKDIETFKNIVDGYMFYGESPI